ncbi:MULTISPECIES: hypothetical protein [unclassified Exiguobacterium]|uniref:family 4 glycosyl hydrolase n=2 Tax=unclassified Exiguobacterium TaxID=2644629 RepID=UPI001BE70631
MPAGLVKAFRTILVLIELANEMAVICPDAWLVNFTNLARIVIKIHLTTPSSRSQVRFQSPSGHSRCQSKDSSQI